MPRPAENRSKRRRSHLSDWLPAGLLLLGVCAIGVYLTQDAQSLEQIRDSLGFGRAAGRPPQPDKNQSAAAADLPNPAQDPDDSQFGSEFDEQSDQASVPQAPVSRALASRDDASGSDFLPANRTRRPAAIRGETSGGEADLQLDSRFESDRPVETATDRVRTAELVEPANEPAAGGPRSAIRRNGAQIGKRPVPRVPTSEFEDPDPTFNSVQLTAGDNENGAAASRRPSRTTTNNNPKTSPANTNPGPKAFDLAEVVKMIEQGQEVEAYQQLADAYVQMPSQRPLFQRQLDEVAQRIYFSPQAQLQPPYEIQPGDQLRKIASKYQLSWQYLSRLNQVDAKKIRPGKLLKVFQGPFQAKVDLSDFELTILLNGQYVKRYSVGIGKMDTTPIGEFTVHEKLENPTYYGPNGMVLEADDPQNPLGERWIDIGNSFGIHGTIEPDSIGKSESAGCVRMRNDDVAEVYDLLTVGSQVRIQR